MFKLNQGWVVNIYILVDSDFRMRNFSQDRFTWKKALEDELRRRKFIEEDLFSPHSTQIVNPRTPLLRVLCRQGREPSEDFCEIFSAVYLPELGATDGDMKKLNSKLYVRLTEEFSGGEDETQ